MNNNSGKRIVEYTLIVDGDVPTEELGIHILKWLDERFGAVGALIPKDEAKEAYS